MASLPQFQTGDGQVDPFERAAIGTANSNLYGHLVGNLKEYPIPRLWLPDGNGKLFLEVSCNWGCWCLAAAKSGYCPAGIDPSLKAIRAARRVAWQLGVETFYIVVMPILAFSHRSV